MTHHSHSPLARRLAGGIKRARFFVIGFWALVVALGLAFGLRFLDATVSDFPAPEGRCVRAVLLWVCGYAVGVDVWAGGWAACIDLDLDRDRTHRLTPPSLPSTDPSIQPNPI